MKKIVQFICLTIMACSCLTGCGSEPATESLVTLEDGIYSVDFNTDSSMFHVNEAKEGKGELTVENGQMTIHVSLTSKNIVNLFAGLAEDAQKDGAELLQPTVDTVTYSDGSTEEVHGFDIPVPSLDAEFDCALIGTKGKWYDHKVSVSNPVKIEEGAKVTEISTDLEDGTYRIEVSMEGGSGRATVASPTVMNVKDGKMYVQIEWSSPNYDYMIVEGEKYLPINDDGNCIFEIPVPALEEPIEMVADTTAMSVPHEITYTFTFHGAKPDRGNMDNFQKQCLVVTLCFLILIVVTQMIVIYIVRKMNMKSGTLNKEKR